MESVTKWAVLVAIKTNIKKLTWGSRRIARVLSLGPNDETPFHCLALFVTLSSLAVIVLMAFIKRVVGARE